MKYGNMTFGQAEALVNKLGGMDTVEGILSDTIEFVLKTVSFLVATSKLVVNYDRSIEDSVKAGKYDDTNSSITDKNFPSSEIGEKEVEFGMFHFNKVMDSSEDVIAEMKKVGFRPATMKELFAYGEKNPEEQRKCPIIALGSVAGLSGGRHVGELYGSDGRRGAGLGYFDGGWRESFRFLAVRI